MTPPAAPLAADLGAGFVDVTGAVAAAPPFALATARSIPDLVEPENSVAVAGDLDGDGNSDLVTGRRGLGVAWSLGGGRFVTPV